LEALKERGLLFQNAPHLVKNQSFIIPAYDWWESPFYTVGLKMYDLMAGKFGLGPSRHISREETIKALPTVDRNGLRGGIEYYDGQFDDTRMVVSLAQTCSDYEGTVINYMRVEKLVKEKGLISGVEAVDQETGYNYRIKARVVINATGVFADGIMKMDNPENADMIRPSQGIHLVLGREFLKSSHAVMVPQTSDGRVLFAVPWHNKVIVGTTDTLVEHITLEPRATEEEIDFVLKTAGQYLVKQPGRKDVLSVFAGLRPLAANSEEGKATKEISRHHKTMVSVSGLISVIGGKWTTYRKMAEDAVNYAVMIGKLSQKECITDNLPIHGYTKNSNADNELEEYGTDESKIRNIEEESKPFKGYLSESLQIRKSQVIWAVREEMARTVEDILARRTRALFLDARESIRITPLTAELMAAELGYGKDWVDNQVEVFTELAKGYLIGSDGRM
jgi:glycerol-3-phosphate dehydrogenase